MTPRFPLQVSENGRRLLDASGTPFLVQGDAAWSLIANTSLTEADAYLADRQERGFNTLVVNLIESTYARHAPASVDGVPPFTEAGRFTAPHEPYMAHAEAVLQRCLDRGFTVLLGPAYLGWPHPRPGEPAEGWHETVLRNGEEGCRAWGEYLARRFGHFPHLVWQIGGDRNPDEATPALRALVDGLRAGGVQGPFVSHVYAYCSALDLPGLDWVTFNLTYGYGDLYPQVLRDTRREPPVPTILVEAFYEGEWDASPLQVRRQAWASVLAGGCGHIFGNRPIWLFDPGWRDALDSPGSRAMTVFGRTLARYAWHRLRPDAPATILDPAPRPRPDTQPFLAASPEGDLAIGYASTPAPFAVNTSALGGGTHATTWVEPATGESLTAAHVTGRTMMTPPFAEDAVLILERVR